MIPNLPNILDSLLLGKVRLLPIIIGGLITTVLMLLLVIFVLRAWWTTPFHWFGFANSPEQPIAFPHTVHVDEAGINCAFCHRNVSSGDEASVPALEQCMFCHTTINTETNPEISKLIAHFNADQPIDWVRVHRLPDHVQFAHEPHIRFLTQARGLSLENACATCHGDVRNMEEVEQVRSLKMGDCVDCHRDNTQYTDNKDITDCVTCHY